jgi:cytochrome P450
MTRQGPAPGLAEGLARQIDQHCAGVDDAYAAYGELRAQCPVAHSERNGGYYILSRHADVRRAALDWRTFSSAKGTGLPQDRTRPPLPALEYDPPEHIDWRKRYTDAITPGALEAIEPHIHRIADDLIDRFAARGHCDLVAEYAEPLPVLGICAVIGLEGPKVDEIRALALQLTSTAADPVRQQVAFAELGAFILGELQERRRNPRNDYLTRIAQIQIDGRPMDDYELSIFMVGFLVAGHETTTASLTGLLSHVVGRPELVQRLLDDDAAMAAAIEEAVRLTSPFHGFSRTTTGPVDIGDVTIPADQVVRLCWAAANRDAEVFADANLFDIDRERNPHLGFGAGRHVCAGAPFARLEMRIAARKLLSRLAAMTLSDGDAGWHFVGGMMTLPRALHATFTPQDAI